MANEFKAFYYRGRTGSVGEALFAFAAAMPHFYDAEEMAAQLDTAVVPDEEREGLYWLEVTARFRQFVRTNVDLRAEYDGRTGYWTVL